jgi:hypothetical protein
VVKVVRGQLEVPTSEHEANASLARWDAIRRADQGNLLAILDPDQTALAGALASC